MRLYDEENQWLENYSPRPKGEIIIEDNLFLNKVSIDVSIILPCYNVELYLVECLESLINLKTAYQFEIIAVNDGSTDATLNILIEYSQKCENLVIVDQENQGPAGARNIGMKMAKGQYLVFVDSDDFISENYIDVLTTAAKSVKASMAVCSYKTFRGNRILKECFISEGDFNKINGCPWAKIFDRSLFDHILYPENYWYEDSIIGLVKLQAKRIVFVPEAIYFYRSNKSGIVITSKRKPKALDTFYITDLVLETVKKMYGEDYIRSEDYKKTLVDQFFLNHQRLKYAPKKIRKLVFAFQSQFIIKEGQVENLADTRYGKALITSSFWQAEIAVKVFPLVKILRFVRTHMKYDIRKE